RARSSLLRRRGFRRLESGAQRGRALGIEPFGLLPRELRRLVLEGRAEIGENRILDRARRGAILEPHGVELIDDHLRRHAELLGELVNASLPCHSQLLPSTGTGGGATRTFSSRSRRSRSITSGVVTAGARKACAQRLRRVLSFRH